MHCYYIVCSLEIPVQSLDLISTLTESSLSLHQLNSNKDSNKDNMKQQSLKYSTAIIFVKASNTYQASTLFAFFHEYITSQKLENTSHKI